MNKIIKNITVENYNNFKNSFVNAKEIFWDDKNNKLIHPGEYGIYREDLVKKWLSSYIPEKFGVSSGFIVNSNGYVSTQCDIIIYDKEKTPTIEGVGKQRFFPIETVSCVGEIKSDINTVEDLKTYLKKLAEIKEEREKVKNSDPYYGCKKLDFNPRKNPFHNIFTFLICHKFKFSIDLNKINYTENHRFKHNLVLSLQDGILDYSTISKKTNNLSFPFAGNNIHVDNFRKNDIGDFPIPIINFLSALQMALNMNILLDLDMTIYLTDDILEKIE
ncbi:MAG: hypothetical protein PHU42_02835 [Patescibacteria group bacterium]|nr:hypothetical protein [Patescibacteria group bacterium]